SEKRGASVSSRLSAADRQAVLEILRDTKSDLPAYFKVGDTGTRGKAGTSHGLRAASRPTASLGRGLAGADKRARKSSFPKRGRVVDVVDTPGLDLDVLETRRQQLFTELTLVKGAGDAPDPQLPALADLVRHVAPGDDVRHREAAARP